MKKTLILIICILVLISIHHSYAFDDGYTLGLQKLEAGKWKEALQIWEAEYDSLKTIREVDPRIGITFIELVTKKNYYEIYPQASEIYMWGFCTLCRAHCCIAGFFFERQHWMSLAPPVCFLRQAIVQ